MNIVFHKELARGRWFGLSLMEQMGNIGSEVGRAAMWYGKNEEHLWHAANRALELFDLTLADVRWKGRLREIARAREAFCDAMNGGEQKGSNLADLDVEFLPFAAAARKDLS